MSAGVYGITSWPPPKLRDFVFEFQRQHHVTSYGQPHFNLRYPFLWADTEEELIDKFQTVCTSIPAFQAEITGWADFPNALYIGIRPSLEVFDAHERVLEVGGASLYAGLDQSDFVPHLTVALGLTEENRAGIIAAATVQHIPRRAWTVSSLVLTRDEGGDLKEISKARLGV
jgi:2'-5' RNA ligase